ncbi:hypothetical protein CY34DRAFT_206827 [Suillus luteus UH-Slu-Lm8-n1]|uniref:Uncharacterized protein n=1 Tax=Suillus luteus UH-Slu-Lm8-n1 TaxID=930992 RepID=A0A0D0B4I4_9AGAM|nr:hypothetical protein CY34DRAFT_206827 [Suillus luteus UH-Slu-Lm8-n1]
MHFRVRGGNHQPSPLSTRIHVSESSSTSPVRHPMPTFTSRVKALAWFGLIYLSDRQVSTPD